MRRFKPMLRSFLVCAIAGTFSIRPAIAQNPAVTPDPLLAQANALMQSQNYAEAATAFEKLAANHPEQFIYWVRLGIARQLGGDRPRALEAYRKGVQLGAGQTAKYNMGSIFSIEQNSDSAFHWLRESVRSGFSNLQVLTADKDLERLHADQRWTALVDTVKRAAMPCMYRPESRAFDFWIGEWDVTTAAGQPAGKSSVQSLLNGCALFENWSTPGNGDGKSLNSYNADLEIWQQFWTDQTGRVTEYRSSEWVSGSLRYTATQLTPTRQLLRMTFTPVNTDLVRQMGEVSNDDGKTWTQQYDLYYHRRK